MSKKNILDFSYEELMAYMTEELDVKKFRVDQIVDWIYDKHVFEFQEMSNLSKDFRDFMDEKFFVGIPEPIDIKTSKIDKTTKFLWELRDGNTVESVALFYPKRVSACISTQVGCALKCAFCATGASGFTRDLTPGEIIAQVLAMEKIKNIRINNIVYMGMGEPLLNYENTIKSVKMLNDKRLKNLGGRHITISTSGIVPRIEELAEIPIEIRLSVSLHAPTNIQRDKIMPINHKYPVEELIQACKNYQKITNKRVTFEYTAIKGFNDSEDDARNLAALISDLKVMVNVIPVNDNPAGFEKPSKRFLDTFARILINKGIDVTIRAEKGSDIEAACGQLKKRFIEKQ
ncbi:MAG: 23S rRNA (adenine(2503)-C(2))-methyltransferase RlmN [Thermotogae bacterium]|nr:23S rRNA (adenine(2503)-C(2))-methyltransferase RlmN [Thermotogota bacterium]